MPRRRGGYAENAEELEPLLVEALAPGDVIMVKGSNGIHMGPLVEALKARFAAGAGEPAGQEIA